MQMNSHQQIKIDIYEKCEVGTDTEVLLIGDINLPVYFNSTSQYQILHIYGKISNLI
jgi:hypothetical protein